MKKLKIMLQNKLKNAVGTSEIEQNIAVVKQKSDAVAAEAEALHKDVNAVEKGLVASHGKLDSVQREICAVHTDLIQAHEKIDALQRESGEVHRDLTQAHEKIDALQRESGEIHRDLTQAHEKIDSFSRDLGYISGELTNLRQRNEEIKSEIIKNQILNRWKIVDAMDSLFYPPDYMVTCRICGHTAPKKSYETKVSQCIFNGGRLERFVCPECDCIFGPMKMFSLDQQELGDEYQQHYSVYDESNTTELGIYAFEQLLPEKGKVYLNYGAGCWSLTSQKLRQQGYTIYDYEPYAPAVADPWLIRKFSDLEKEKYDGIFSNDLIEHLPYPLDELSSIKNLLKDKDSRMTHATGCFDYFHDCTRFHYFFFTGRSLKTVARKLGMNVTVVSGLCAADPHFKIGVFTSPAA